MTEAQAEVVGDVAWVVCNENLLGDQGGATVAAVNIFVRDGAGSGWRLVNHHGSVVSGPAPGAGRAAGGHPAGT